MDTLPPMNYQRRRSIHGILNDSSPSRDYITIVYNIYELVKVLHEKKIDIGINEFMFLLKDNIYKEVRFSYYEAFRSNVLKNSYNPYHGKSYCNYCNYYLYFLNYAYYYFSRIFKNPENEIDRKIVSYESSRNIKKQIDLFIELLEKENNDQL